MKKFLLFALAAGLMSCPLASQAAFQVYHHQPSKQPVKSGAHQTAKCGAKPSKRSGAHPQQARNGAHQGPRNGSQPAITAKPKADALGNPVP
jgi:hypothetical protein